MGILVREIDRPEPLLAHGENLALNPASVMKLVTTLAALDSLGPAHTFKTRVWLEGELKDGVLTGNLTLQGGGDPSLTLERYWLLLREIRARGVREIRGDVLLDGSFYELEPVDPAAFDQAPLRPYNAPAAALLANFNTLNLRLSVVDSTVQARIEGEGPIALDNRLEAMEGPCNGGRESLRMALEDGRLVLSGRYALACGDQVQPLNLLAPEATVAVLFRSLWQELGGLHGGRIRPCTPAAEARLLLEFESPPLVAQVRDINKFSNNVMAKMLFLNLGAQRFGAPATWDKGRRAVTEWLNEKGLWSEAMVIDNGSGLSRTERLTAGGLGRMLAYAAGRPAYYEFAASLPTLGLEGTLKKRLNGAPAVGQAWLKTGSLNGARNLAGYVLGPGGRRRILVMLVNHERAAAVAKAQEALVTWAVTALPAEAIPEPVNPSTTPVDGEIKR